MKNQSIPRRRKLINLFFVGVFICCFTLAANAQTNTSIDSVNCRPCTDEQWNRWRRIYLSYEGVAGQDVTGHQIGLNDAGEKWKVVNVAKRIFCGKLRKPVRIVNLAGPEYDWNLKLDPPDYGEPGWSVDDFNAMLTEAKAATYMALSEAPDWMVQSYIRLWPCGGDCIKGEVTPDQGLWNNEFFPRLVPYIQYGTFPVESSELYGRKICLYGPLVLDTGHFYHPEIHPSELLWWRDSSSTWLMVLQDDSFRYDKIDDFLRPGQLWLDDMANWSRPWSEPPRRAEHPHAYKPDPSGISMGRYDIHELYAQTVTTALNNSAKIDADNGKDHLLQYNGNPIFEVSEKQEEDDYLGVGFAEICRKSFLDRSIIIGYVTINSVVGLNLPGIASGFHVLRIDRQEAKVSIGYPYLSNNLNYSKLDSLREWFKRQDSRFDDLKDIALSWPRPGGSELVTDIGLLFKEDKTSSAVIRNVIWRSGHSKKESALATSGTTIIDVPAIRGGELSVELTSGDKYKLQMPELKLAPVINLKSVTPPKPAPNSWPTFAGAAEIASILKEPLGKLVRVSQLTLGLQPYYGPVLDSALALEDETPVTKELNEAVSAAQTGNMTQLQNIFGNNTPFTVDWKLSAINLKTGQLVSVKTDQDKRPGDIAARIELTRIGNTILRLDFPDYADSVYRVDITATMKDNYGISGILYHTLWSHHVEYSPRDTLVSKLVTVAANISGIPGQIIVRSGREIESQRDTTRLVRDARIMYTSVFRASEDGRVTIGELRRMGQIARLFVKQTR